MLERAKAVTRNGAHIYVEYVRYADDLAILVNNDRRQDWLVEAVGRRLREELAKLDVQLNEAKSRLVDLSRGESFGFLGFDFRRVRSLRELKEVFRRFQSQPVEQLIGEINPKLRGWVNYFRIGHASRCFAFVRLWVERRVRRHLMGRGIVGALAGRGGVRHGSTPRSGCSQITECGTWCVPESAPGR